LEAIGKTERTLHRYLFENSRVHVTYLMHMNPVLVEHYKNKKKVLRSGIVQCDKKLEYLKNNFII